MLSTFFYVDVKKMQRMICCIKQTGCRISRADVRADVLVAEVMHMKTISERIQHIRGGTSRRLFADVIGIRESTLRNYENGASLPNSDLVAGICQKLHIRAEWLLFGTGHMRNKETAKVPETITSIQDVATATPVTAPVCQRCERLEEDLREERKERRELSEENRKLWRDNAALREDNANMRERPQRAVLSNHTSCCAAAG